MDLWQQKDKQEPVTTISQKATSAAAETEKPLAPASPSGAKQNRIPTNTTEQIQVF